jgi:hypothetical protein
MLQLIKNVLFASLAIKIPLQLFKEVEVGWTCGTHGGGERCLQGFGWEVRRQETTGKT